MCVSFLLFIFHIVYILLLLSILNNTNLNYIIFTCIYQQTYYNKTYRITIKFVYFSKKKYLNYAAHGISIINFIIGFILIETEFLLEDLKKKILAFYLGET